MALATEKCILERSFDELTVRRGRQYYQAGWVLDIDAADSHRHIFATVRNQRGKQYDVEILVDYENSTINGWCDCYLRYNCKHMVATLLKAGIESSNPVAHFMKHNTTNQAEINLNEFNTWLKETTTTLNNDAHGTVKKQEHHLFYQLELNSGYTSPQIDLFISKILKKGGYGKPKKYHEGRKAHKEALQPIDEEIITGLLFLNRNNFSYDMHDDFMLSDGHQNAKWLKEIIRTGRCFLSPNFDDTITLGDPKPLKLGWELLDDATQKFRATVDDKAVDILCLDELWYLDPTTKICGLAETTVPAKILRKTLTIPNISAKNSKRVATQLKKALPELSQFLPQSINKIKEKPNKNIIPELHLGTSKIKVPKEPSYYYYDQSYDIIEQASAKIIFDYDGLKIPLATTHADETITTMENGNIYSLKRNFEKEGKYLEKLSAHINLQGSFSHDINDEEVFALAQLQSENDYIRFSTNIIPQIEDAGWRVIRTHKAFMEVFYENDITWYSELEEGSDYDYFGLTMGIILDEEKINILPVIANIIKHNSLEDLRKFPENQSVALSLPNGKLLSIPFSRIKPMISTLVELYDSELSEGDALCLSAREAALLFEIEKAFSAAKMRWFGGHKLRDLGKKLSQFKAIKPVTLPKTFKATLRHYQQEGLDWLQFLREYRLGGILADDMGLGKTVQTLAHLCVEKNKRRMKKPSLIVAPTSLMVNWYQEAQRFSPTLKVVVFHGDERHCHADTLENYDVILTTYPLLVRDKALLKEIEYYYLILDEAQFIKNHKAKSTQIVQQLTVEHRLCLTGTPMENHLGELWSLFHFLMPGFLGDNKRFAKIFRSPIERHKDGETRKRLAQRVKPFMLRRLKEEVAGELPEKTEIIRSVELQGPQRDLYESIRLSMEKKVRDAISKNGLSRSHIIILDALLKLRQTCCDPKLLKLSSARMADKHSAKMDLLMDLLPNLVEEGRKILLFSQFTSMLKIIEQALKEAGLFYVKLTGSTKNRAAPITSFQNGEVPIFLISLKAGGTGLNLTAADTVIHYDPWWNPAVEDQATDRAHRIGQNKSVFVYKLLAAGTVEEAIFEMQQNKRALMEGLFSEQDSKKLSLSSEDLEQLFKPI